MATIESKKLQKEIYDNKVAKGFNVKDIYLEFCYLNEELAEAFAAYHKKKEDFPEELADVAIFLLGIAEICNIDLGEEILKKVEKNKNRQYKKVDGVLTRIKD